MDKLMRQIEIKTRLERAFNLGGGVGHAFERLVDYIVELEERIEAIENGGNHERK